jgi:DNA-binding response OmpR family regulator
MTARQVPLILIASTSTSFADSVASQLRREGNVVYVTHSVDGCLRVATSVGPDLVLLDRALPSRLEHLIKAHPTSAGAQILHLSESVPRPTYRLRRGGAAAPRASSTAGPHAA